MNNLFHQCHADPLGDTAMGLAVGDQRIDHPSAILDHDVAFDLDLVSLRVDLDQAHVAGRCCGPEERIIDLRRFKIVDLVAHFLRYASHIGIERPCKIADRHRCVRALDPDIAIAGLDILDRCFEQMAGDPQDFLVDGFRGQNTRPAAKHRTAARIRAGAMTDRCGIAEDDVDVLHLHAELFGDHLCQRGFHALPLAGKTKACGDRPR